MEGLGFRREGHFLQDVRLADGGWHDEYFYAILDEEWAARAGGGK
jgi:RimJ/RimL family protein N-acetyltransferase